MRDISPTSRQDTRRGDGEARLPPRVERRLAVMKEGAAARIDNFAGLLAKLEGTEQALESCRALSDCVTNCDVSRAALVRIPSALAKLQNDTRSLTVPKGVDKHVLAGEANAIANGILCELANAALAQRDVGSRAGVTLIGEGSFNWALSDYSKVVMISKGRDGDAFDAYRLRRFCAERLNEAGLEQPRVETIARLPVLHAVTEIGSGEPLHQLLWSARQAGSPDLSPGTASEALLALGAFFRSLSTVELEGYGRLSRSTDSPRFRGDSDQYLHTVRYLTRAHLHPLPEDLAAAQKIERLGIFTASELAGLREYAARLEARVEPPILGHNDPHAGNFLFDRETGRITSLDWDSARAMTPTAQLARIYGAWVSHAPSHVPDPKGDFAAILAGYAPDPSERSEIVQKVKEMTLLQLYDRTVLVAWGRPVEPAPGELSELERQLTLLREMGSGS